MKRFSYRTAVPLCVTLTLAMGSLSARASDSGVGQTPGSPVTVAGHIPNWFAANLDDTRPGNGYFPSARTFIAVDSAHHLAFEFTDTSRYGSKSVCGGGTPYPVASLNLDTGALVAEGCTMKTVAYGAAWQDPYTFTRRVIVDPASEVLIQPFLDPSSDMQHLAVYSERSLRLLSDFCVGAAPNLATTLGSCTVPQGASAQPTQTPYPFMHGASLYAPTNDVLILSDNNNIGLTNPGSRVAGVSISDYRLSGGPGGVTLAGRWVMHLTGNQCNHVLDWAPSDNWNQQAAYLSDTPDGAAVFVPCSADAPANGQPGEASIVKVPLDATCLCPASDPPTQASPVTSPAPAGGFLFDSAGERGYLLPSTANPSFGGTVIVYDGHQSGSIIGRFEIQAKPDPSQGNYLFALDPDTGRFYAEDPLSGLRVVDGRRTPVGTGSFFPIVAPITSTQNPVSAADFVAPDKAHPYPRLVLGLLTTLTADNQSRVEYFTTVSDLSEVSQDPPSTTVDDSTYHGDIPAGATVATSYRAAAIGYGVHSDLVGGYAGPLYNNASSIMDGVPPPPYAQGSLDVALGTVTRALVQDGETQSAASAAADVNGRAAQVYRTCSDAYSVQACFPPHCDISSITSGIPGAPGDPCYAVASTVAGASNPTVNPSQTTTAQDWPYPSAECSQPGKPQDAHQEVDGYYETPFHSTAPSASPAPSPSELQTAVPIVGTTVSSGGATGTSAKVDCLPGVKATGRYACAGTQAPGGATPDASAPQCNQSAPTIVIADAETTTTLLDPSQGGGLAQSTVTATAVGIRITLPNGSVVKIGKLVQTAHSQAGGKNGTAMALRSVGIDDVAIENADGTETTLCAGPCMGPGNDVPQALLDALNGVDPVHFYVTFPAPAEPFGVAADGLSPKGSPGGYQAIVEANPAEQAGDRQFNQMSGYGGAEPAMLPALRVVLFDPGPVEINREILDFAGVEADAELGFQVSPADAITDGASTDNTQAEIAAGVPPTSTFLPGSSATPAFPGQPAASPYHGGVLGVLERTLDGLRALVRSPGAALQMAAFLIMLGLPALFARRRWAWRASDATRG